MAINEPQLQTWSNAPSSTKIQFTYQQIRKALEQSDVLSKVDYEVYLQGSYANSTNIRMDSDVDVVVQLNSTFSHNASDFIQDHRGSFSKRFFAPTYYWHDFYRDVKNAMSAYFGDSSVEVGNKSIKLIENQYRVNADVVTCLQYQHYDTPNAQVLGNFKEGIKFWTANENLEIINFPKIHIENSKNKNSQNRTNTEYKSLIRVFKNIKKQLIEQQIFTPKIAPSYFLECMTYNVPDNHFENNYTNSLKYSLDFILRRCAPNNCVTSSHEHLLFGSNPWQWNQKDAYIFFQSVENFIS
jgi:hypothetical protein